MTYILSIETSTSVCSVAIHKEKELLASFSLYLDRSHSEKLGTLIVNILAACGLKQQDLQAVAISGGPGSYTGLRIGASLAKGICYSLQIPLVAINTLEALALQISLRQPQADFLCPMLDARRMEVYALITDVKGKTVEPVQPVLLEENDSLITKYLEKGTVMIFGNGSVKTKKVITHKNSRFINDVLTDASTVGELAWEKYKLKQFEDLAYYEPFYLKEFKVTKPKKLV